MLCYARLAVDALVLLLPLTTINDDECEKQTRIVKNSGRV